MNKTDYNIWIISGEASGDMYGARLARELKQKFAAQNRRLRLAGMGGPQMQETDMEIMVDSTELGVVGFIEVFKQIFTFIGIFLKLLKQAKKERPDAVVLIDYPGFNLRFAKQLYKNNIPVIWYVSPQVWSWGKHRIPKLAKYCSKMMVIFPFETETYQATDLDVEFVGHPLVDIINERTDQSIKRLDDTVLLLPGSRTHEIESLLPPMLDTVSELYKKHPQLKFVLSTPRERIYHKVEQLLADYRTKHPDAPQIKLTCGDTAKWQQAATAGLAASGTVTVECAIAGLPLVVCYRMNPLTFMIARLLVTLYRGYFTMANIIADKEVFKEFLQFQVTKEEMVPAMESILPDGAGHNSVIADINQVKELLQAGSSNASANAADCCMNFVLSAPQKG
jgi:lipid-A-disaccharide synthase